MCMLTFLPPDVQPHTDRLRNGAVINGDGHGFAILDTASDPGHPSLIVRRAMAPYALIREFEKLRKRYPHGPALFHSRWGTSGEKGKGNCHPFHLGEDGNDRLTVVAHNGVLGKECWPRKGDDRCDTRIFAEELLPHRNLNKPRGLARLARWLGGDKLVILTANPRYQQHWYLINEQEGHWVDDVWYSNYDYSGYGYYVGGYRGSGSTAWGRLPGKGRWDGWDEWAECNEDREWTRSAPMALEAGTLATRRVGAECPVCLAVGTVSTVTGACAACGTCTDCLEDVAEGCLCYTPRFASDDVPAAVDDDGDGTDTGWPGSGDWGPILGRPVAY